MRQECLSRYVATAASGGCLRGTLQGLAGFGGEACGRVELQPETISETGQIVKNTDDMGYFQTGLVVKTEITQGLPILLLQARRGGTELLSQGTKCQVPC